MGEPHTHQWKYAHRDPSENDLLTYRCSCGLRTTEVASLPAPQNKQQTIEEFLAMRLRDIEVMFEGYRFDDVYTDLEHKRREALRFLIYSLQFVLEWHSNWPVLVEEPMPEISRIAPDDDIRGSLNRFNHQLTQRMAWFTQEQYRLAFGSEPPTAPMLKHMAQSFAHHPHFNPDWA